MDIPSTIVLPTINHIVNLVSSTNSAIVWGAKGSTFILQVQLRPKTMQRQRGKALSAMGQYMGSGSITYNIYIYYKYLYIIVYIFILYYNMQYIYIDIDIYIYICYIV